MSIFNSGNFAKPYNVPQPQLNSSDRTAQLKSKTKYAAAVNLAKNGGTLTKMDGSKHVGTVQTTSSALTSASSYADLLDVTKGKYLLTPPPSSDLTTSFQPSTGDVYYGNFTVSNYADADIPVTVLGLPTVNLTSKPYAYMHPNQLVYSTNPATTGLLAPIVVDPEYRMFYSGGTCSTRSYFKHVRIDPSIEVSWSADAAGGEVVSSRPHNEQQAQRIIAHQAQSLRGFQFPTRVHFDLDNCESKPSITPVAPDAPVIYVESISGTDPFTVTIAWLHGFDGGSPITTYTVYRDDGPPHNASVPPHNASVPPQPCLNTYQLTDVRANADIWITASNCVPKEPCRTLTSGPSNRVSPD